MELLFAKRLRELRKEKGLSQVELGESPQKYNYPEPIFIL